MMRRPLNPFDASDASQTTGACMTSGWISFALSDDIALSPLPEESCDPSSSMRLKPSTHPKRRTGAVKLAQISYAGAESPPKTAPPLLSWTFWSRPLAPHDHSASAGWRWQDGSCGRRGGTDAVITREHLPRVLRTTPGVPYWRPLASSDACARDLPRLATSTE
jgi:hypothetical protein